MIRRAPVELNGPLDLGFGTVEFARVQVRLREPVPTLRIRGARDGVRPKARRRTRPVASPGKANALVQRPLRVWLRGSFGRFELCERACAVPRPVLYHSGFEFRTVRSRACGDDQKRVDDCG